LAKIVKNIGDKKFTNNALKAIIIQAKIYVERLR
jgi:hypothetical protein